MRVTLIAADMSQNGLSRTLLLADILARDFEVDIIGTRFGADVWEPARSRRFHRVVPGARWPAYARSAATLLRSIRGDVVYAHKPLPTSFGLALAHRARTGTPVVLDVEDDELTFRPAIPPLRSPLRYAAAFTVPNGRPWTRLTVARAGWADGVTVASTGLQWRFGGVIVPHAKDTDRLRPGLVDRDAARRRAGLAAERVVMFMGTPRPFKGIEDAAAAVGRMRHRARFVLAGAALADPYVAQLRQRFPEMTIMPPYSFDDVASVLEIADVVVVPQRDEPQTRHQLPSKLLDAMALAKPVVATAVADIPAILAAGRGRVVPPGDVAALAGALDDLFDDPAAAEAMGARGRRWCVEEASYGALQGVLGRVIRSAALARARGRFPNPASS